MAILRKKRRHDIGKRSNFGQENIGGLKGGIREKRKEGEKEIERERGKMKGSRKRRWKG